MVAGISVSFNAWKMNFNLSFPGPTWMFTTPALPASRPPTRESAQAWANCSNVGAPLRWSEMATSPIPIALSITIISLIIDKAIGIGEVAISDHRNGAPTFEQFANTDSLINYHNIFNN